MYTEDEARKKWCPMAAQYHDSTEQACLSGGCMWWVWDTECTAKKTAHPGDPDTVEYDGKGHCGATGSYGACK